MSLKKPTAESTKREIGFYFEKYTEKQLKKQGMKPLEHSYLYYPYEIDLIMLDGTEIVFVEVKERLDTERFSPEFYADKNKMNNIFKAASGYIAELKKKNVDILALTYRFDLASIIRDADFNVEKFEYHKNFFKAAKEDLLKYAVNEI